MRRIGCICLLLAAGAVPAQEVTLPLERYDELRGRAHPAPEPEPEPPVPITFEQAVVDVVVGPTSAGITQELELALYGSGWQSVPRPWRRSISGWKGGSSRSPSTFPSRARC